MENHWNRRTFLQNTSAATIAALGLGSPIASLMAEPTNDLAKKMATADTVILLWMAGGIDYSSINLQDSTKKFHTKGLALGFDKRINDSFLVGGALGYGHDKTDIDASGSQVKSHQKTGSVYISYQSPKIVINIIILNKQCRINTVLIFQAFLSHHFNYLLLHVLMIKLGKVRFLT
jgi:hypothetical protein